ncbi:MAG: hypothetical protein ACR2J4_00530, partial [Deinococcus sp.]
MPKESESQNSAAQNSAAQNSATRNSATRNPDSQSPDSQSPDSQSPAPLPADLFAALASQRIETPSWGYGNSGTRFKTFAWPGAARDIYEKLDDAAEVQRLTGIAPGVAIHIPWDEVEDYAGLARYASERGLTIGAVNPNVFQDERYRLGSVTHPDEEVREAATSHLLDCVEVMRQTGS